MADLTVYFISDTHLGDGSGADQFLFPKQLMDLLVRIESESNAELVLLGDFMELWSGSLEAVFIHHAPVFQALARIAAKHQVTYVVGNHDCLPWYYYLGYGLGKFRVVEEYTLKRAKLVAIHGHQFDPVNQVAMEDGQVKVPWTRKLTEVVGVAERLAGAEAGQAVADIADVLSRAVAVLHRQSPGQRGYPAGEQMYEDAARNYMREGFRYVLMGHTHHPLVHAYGNKLYINTGSWVWNRYPPTYARLAGGRLELLDANNHQPYATEA